MEVATQTEAPERERATQETFAATLDRLQQQQASKIDVVVNTAEHLSLVLPVEDGVARPRIAFGPAVPELAGREFDVLPYAHQQIAGRSRVPWNFYDRLRNDHPDVLVNTVNALWSREPENRLVRTLSNGRQDVRAWLSDRYRVIDNLPFLTAALEEAEKHGAQVLNAHVDDTRLYVKLVTPRMTNLNLVPGTHNRIDDPIQAGVIIRNSEVGDGKVVVSPFVLRLVCTNGLISTETYSKIHLGAGLDDGVQSTETQEKEGEFIFSAIRDWVGFALAEGNLEKIADQFRRAEATRIDTSARVAVANVVRFGGLNKTEGASVLERYLRADHDTQFTLVNAVTEEAHLARSTYRRQVEHEELGGKLLEMEAAAFTRLVSRPLSEKEIEGAFTGN